MLALKGFGKFLVAMFLLLGASLAFSAPVPKELTKQTDEQAIVGTWKMVSHSLNGETLTPQQVEWWLEVNGKAIMNPGDTAIEYKLRTELSPKGLDWQFVGAKPHLGLYALDGDTLKVVITSGIGQERPKELKPATGMIYGEFKRVSR